MRVILIALVAAVGCTVPSLAAERCSAGKIVVVDLNSGSLAETAKLVVKQLRPFFQAEKRLADQGELADALAEDVAKLNPGIVIAHFSVFRSTLRVSSDFSEEELAKRRAEEFGRFANRVDERTDSGARYIVYSATFHSNNFSLLTDHGLSRSIVDDGRLEMIHADINQRLDATKPGSGWSKLWATVETWCKWPASR